MYQLLKQCFLPFTLSWLLTLVALAYVWWIGKGIRKRLLIITIPLLLMLVVCIPATSHFALGSLEWQYPPLAERPEDTDAIVVLSGSIRMPDATRPEPDLEEDTLYRLLHGLELYRHGKPCPIVVSGGRGEPTLPDLPFAHVMRSFLVRQGVPPGDVIVETESLTTYENARECRKVLEPRKIERVVLVTDASHMYRAVKSYEKQGFTVVPAPCNFRVRPFRWSVGMILPSAAGAEGTERACHEWLGTIWYWANGRL